MKNNASAEKAAATVTRRQMLGLMGLVGGGALLALAGCSGTGGASGSGSPAQSSGTSVAAGSSDASGSSATGSSGSSVLVAYYSATGNTAAVAKRLASDLGADTFEVAPKEPYSDDDLDFNDDDSRVSREYQDESRRDVPLAQTTPDGFDGYDTVLVGYPIWWGGAAWPIDHFVSDNDFTGKRVVTFCTSQVSGLGDTTDDLAKLAGTGDWEEGRRFEEDASNDDIDDFASSLGL